jgi:hypothetical protein
MTDPNRGERARTPQAELYHRLRERGVRCAVEVHLPAVSARSRSGRFRADLAVYKGSALAALAECKASTRRLAGRQRENYDGAGVPYIVAGYDNLDEAARWLEERVS